MSSIMTDVCKPKPLQTYIKIVPKLMHMHTRISGVLALKHLNMTASISPPSPSATLYYPAQRIKLSEALLYEEHGVIKICSEICVGAKSKMIS